MDHEWRLSGTGVMGLQKLPHRGRRLHKAQPPLRGTANGLVWLAHAVCFGDWQGMSLGKEVM